jgi:hypothetical protein
MKHGRNKLKRIFDSAAMEVGPINPRETVEAPIAVVVASWATAPTAVPNISGLSPAEATTPAKELHCVPAGLRIIIL